MRVGVSVMNSRRAQNERPPKSATVTLGPSKKPTANIAVSIHQERTRKLNCSTTAGLTPSSVWRRSICPTTVAAVSTISNVVKIQNVGKSKESMKTGVSREALGKYKLIIILFSPGACHRETS